MKSSDTMKDWQRTRLNNCLTVIKKDLDIKDTLLKLRVRNLIDADDEELILNDSVYIVNAEKRQKLIDIIQDKGEGTYWAFCHLVKMKTPFIFELLHKCEDTDDVEKVCPECNWEEDVSKCCNICSGLFDVLSRPEFGIQRPEEIIEVFQSYHNLKQLWGLEEEKQKNENIKLKKVNRKLLDNLESEKKQVAEKQKEIEAIVLEREDTKIEREVLNITVDDLRSKIQKLEANLQGRNQLDDQPIYENYDIAKLEHDISRKTLEELLQRQKIEHDRVFTMLQDKLKYSETSLKNKEEELIHQKACVKVVNNEKDEAIKERNHLLKKVHELNSSRESQLQLLENTNKQLDSNLEELHQQIMQLRQENEHLKEQRSAEGSSNGRKLRSDKNVILRKISGKFGINFGTKKGPLLFGESRITITSINSSHLVTTDVNVEENDYVICINNENVQEADINAVRSIILKNSESLDLVIRKPARKILTVQNVNLNNIILDKFEDLGVRLPVSVVVEKKSLDCALQAMDEIVKINNKDIASLPIADIKKLIAKHVKQRQCELTVHRYTLSSDEEGRQHTRSSWLSESKSSWSLQDSTQNSDTSGDSDPLSPDSPNYKPRLPPRGISASNLNLSDLQTDQFNVLQYSENYGSGKYQRVVTKEYDKKGNLISDSSIDSNENEIVTIDVIKQSYETFGLHIIGGNKTGIYVEAVDVYTPAQKSDIQVGWKLLQVNGFSLEKVAFCYANELLQKFASGTKITLKLEKTPIDHYRKMMKRRPHDAFHIETLVDYTAQDSTELSFKKGEILCVNDSYVRDKPNQPYKWQATREEGAFTKCGIIPRQISSRAPSAVMEHKYEEIDPLPPDSPSKKQNLLSNLKRKQQSEARVHRYKILESVGEVLV